MSGNNTVWTHITIKDMSDTSIEFLIDDVVKGNKDAGDYTPILDRRSFESIKGGAYASYSIPHIFFSTWQKSETVDFTQMQYIAASDECSDDVELILRQSIDGDRTIIAVFSDAQDTDYDEATVEMWYIGTEDGLRSEFNELNIAPENISIWLGSKIYPADGLVFN